MPNNQNSILNQSADNIVNSALSIRNDNLTRSANNVARWENAVADDIWKSHADDGLITSTAKGAVNMFGGIVKNFAPRNGKGELTWGNPFTRSNYARNISSQLKDNKLNYRKWHHNMAGKIAEPAMEVGTTALMFVPVVGGAAGSLAKGALRGTGKFILKHPMGTAMTVGGGAMYGLGQREQARAELAETDPEAYAALMAQEQPQEKPGFSFSKLIKENPKLTSAAMAAAPALLGGGIGYGVGGKEGALWGGGLGALIGTILAARNYMASPIDRDVKLTSPSTWKYLYQDPWENYKRRQMNNKINDFLGFEFIPNK